MSATIKDVARETGLAISTISKYMNGGSVRPANAKIIEEAVQKLRFSPNRAAKGLKSARSFCVCLITGTVHSPHTAMLLQRFERRLREMGYSLMFVSNEMDRQMTKQQIDYMLDEGIDGMIIACVNHRSELGTLAREAGIPIVMMEEEFDNEEGKLDLIQADCACGAYTGVEYLIQKGHRRIAILTGDLNTDTGRERLQGYERAMQDYGIPVDPSYVFHGVYTFESGYAGMEQLILMKERPTAVFISSYELSLGAVAAVNQYNIQVPDDLSLVVFDDYELSGFFKPALTAIEQPLDEMALTACSILDMRIREDKTDFPLRLRFKTRFHERDSVKDLYSWNKPESTL